MSIRVDLVVGRRGEDKKEEEGEGAKEEVVDEEENEVADDASDADSGFDPGQDDQVNFKMRIPDKRIMRSSSRGKRPSVATVSSPLNSTTAWTGFFLNSRTAWTGPGACQSLLSKTTGYCIDPLTCHNQILPLHKPLWQVEAGK